VLVSNFGLAVRPFAGEAEHGAAIAEFLGRSQDLTGKTVGWHPGEFYWNAFRPSSPSRFATIERGDRILALAYFRPPGEIEFVLDRAFREADADLYLAREVVRLAVTRPGATGPISISVGDQDEWTADLVRALGFENTQRSVFRSSWLALSEDLPVSLSEGFRLIAMDRGADLDARVNLHRNVWAPSKFDRADYDVLRETALYRFDLDIAAVASDGTYASYGIGWFDPVSRIGQLEPVGTHSQFRGLGLGKAVISAILNRMRGAGAVGSWVLSEEDNAASNALYQSVGFQQTMRLELWERRTQV
jgi:ribosomal protein S18 acetylase RimI-like enzyme